VKKNLILVGIALLLTLVGYGLSKVGIRPDGQGSFSTVAVALAAAGGLVIVIGCRKQGKSGEGALLGIGSLVMAAMTYHWSHRAGYSFELAAATLLSAGIAGAILGGRFPLKRAPQQSSQNQQPPRQP
jgi:hypothetical protein